MVDLLFYLAVFCDDVEVLPVHEAVVELDYVRMVQLDRSKQSSYGMIHVKGIGT